MGQVKPSQFNKNALLIILGVGFVLRAIPVLWGIPVNRYIWSYHPDEGKVLLSILKFPEIYWTTEPFPGYGTVVQYIIGSLLFPLKYFFFKSPDLFYEYYIIVSIFSRFVSIFLGTACIYITYLISKKIYDEKVGLLSAMFLSVAFYHTLNSPLITLDVSSSFMLMLNFLLCYRAIETNRWRDYILLGIASGFLVGTKTVLGIFICIPFILNALDLFPFQNNYEINRTQFVRRIKYLFFYVFIAGCVFIIFHPHIFLDIDKYLAFYLREKHDWMDRSRGTIDQLFYIWGSNTIKSIGPFVPFFAFIGNVLPGKKNLRLKLMMLLFVILYYGFWRWFLGPRYIIAVSPIICIFAANACLLFFYHKNKILKNIGIALATIALGYGLYWCVSGISLRFNDTRPSVAKFIINYIPEDTTIGVSGVSEKYDWRTHSWRYPKIDPKRYRIVNFLNVPEVFILNMDDGEKILDTINSEKLIKDYVLPEAYYKDWYRYSAPSPRIFKFYDDLLVKNKSNYVLIKSFKREVNVPLEFAPPEIRIYKKIP